MHPGLGFRSSGYVNELGVRLWKGGVCKLVQIKSSLGFWEGGFSGVSDPLMDSFW